MRRYTTILLLVVLGVTALVHGQEGTESIPKTSRKTLSPEEKARIREERKQERRKLESCLTLVRSLFAKDEEKINSFVMEHPTSTKDKLMNKILAEMMLNCREIITEEQIATLQTFKDHPGDFDHTDAEYAPLLDFSLEKYAVDETLPIEEQEAPIRLSQAESAMQAIVEDLSDEMKREREEELKQNRGQAPAIFFFELSNMSKGVAFLYISGIIGFFGLIFYVLIQKLLVKPVEFVKEKKGSKKASSAKKTQ